MILKLTYFLPYLLTYLLNPTRNLVCSKVHFLALRVCLWSTEFERRGSKEYLHIDGPISHLFLNETTLNVESVTRTNVFILNINN
jgi:hypothetical protein